MPIFSISHPYEMLTEQVTGGQFIGRETIDGAPANHLAFTGEEVDWQVWIKDGDQPSAASGSSSPPRR